jgi:YVTN family beta-propeller protein
MKNLKVFGLTIGPLALLVGCGTLVFDSQTNGCVAYSPFEQSCPRSYYTMDGGQCLYTYFIRQDGDDGLVRCSRDTTVDTSPIDCQGDAGAPDIGFDAGVMPLRFPGKLLPRASAVTYPVNQMQAFLMAPTGPAPFDLKSTVLNLPFQPLFSGTPTSQAGMVNCDSTETILSAGFSRGTVIPTVPCNLSVGTPIATGKGSLELALTPDGKSAFVTNFNGSVSVIDTKTLSIVSTILTPGANPFGIAMSPDGTTAWVASYNTTSPALLVINVASRTVTSTVPLTVVPQNLFTSPDGSLLWITSQLANNVTILDTLTLTPSAAITSIQLPTGIAFNPTGTMAYVASATSPGTVQAVSTLDYSVKTSYTVGNAPVDVKCSGSWLTVMNRSSDFVSQINLATGQVISDPVGLVTNVPHTGLAFLQ